jgi:hypothetical protein
MLQVLRDNFAEHNLLGEIFRSDDDRFLRFPAARGGQHRQCGQGTARDTDRGS